MYLPRHSRRQSKSHLTAIPVRSGRRILFAGMLLATAAIVATPALSPASLAGSNFEIEADANLILNNAPPSVDWGSLAHATPGDPEKRATDVATGSSDTSYKGGVKEDTTCPGTTTGSIPNNKSDLLTFHVYEEPGTGSHPGYLNLAWSRVTDPSGNTLMDFEFNQGSLNNPNQVCSGSPNVMRQVGDLLIEYALDSGTNVEITKRVWNGSAWGAADSLSENDPACGGAPCAEGTVNTTAIAAGNSDGVGARSARTFGEAQLDLRGIFGSGGCAAFGTAMVKSRSSDSFSSQLKDYIDPLRVSIDNCGSITINKVTENDPGNASFGFSGTGSTITGFSLGNGGQKVFSALPAGSYSITETLTAGQLADGWTLKGLECTKSGAGTTASEDKPTGTATINLANGGDVVCTYTNHIKRSPTITTLLDGTHASKSVAIGSMVFDTATLTGATANAGGTVAFTVYTNPGCSQGAQSAGNSKPFVNGTATSDSVQFNSAGTYYWQAVYSGDANNNGATSACTEEVLTVQKASPTGTTAQDLLPNDTFTLTGGTSNAGGTVTFSLFGPDDADCSETAAYTTTVNLTGGTSAATANNTFHAATPGTWRWVVVYSGDTNNNGVTLACGKERFTIDNNAS